MVNWTVVFLSLLLPIYVVFRLETIVRKLTRIQRRQSELERENIKIHNARIIAAQTRGTDSTDT
ncbi:hypothetical protein J2736_001515 [Paenibacillus qinlingensis]|uniref:Uncharacterized protein n=1 Tax=Paenibacillus qinlingensis TaxID=1837343 RepID=A0ABU1NS71_9BACL|nr:hypothetical protein [Paenibacillus qinlingensis]